jgi:hypothetical protein
MNVFAAVVVMNWPTGAASPKTAVDDEVLSERADHGPYLAAGRAMRGLSALPGGREDACGEFDQAGLELS